MMFNGVSPVLPKGSAIPLVSLGWHRNQTSPPTPACFLKAQRGGAGRATRLPGLPLPLESRSPREVMNMHSINTSVKYCAIWPKLYFREEEPSGSE